MLLSGENEEVIFNNFELGNEVMRRVALFHQGTYRRSQLDCPREAAIADALAIAYGTELIRLLSAPPTFNIRARNNAALLED